MRQNNAAETLSRIAASITNHPYVSNMVDRGAFFILLSTIISLRTKDAITELASEKLFALAENPQDMLQLSQTAIEAAIKPAGFYRTKAKNITKICRILQDRYDGKVPNTRDELLKLPGVGRKTANLVLGLCFGIPAICVDIHVHRIANRLGWVETNLPEESEHELEGLMPQDLWISLNSILVRFGQTQCVAISPYCSSCPIRDACPQHGVLYSR